MSFGAIDFGIIVDGTVIIVEAVLHRITGSKERYGGVAKLTQDQMDEEVYQSSRKIRSAAAFGEIIILIVYLPLLALVGVEGKMFGYNGTNSFFCHFRRIPVIVHLRSDDVCIGVE